MAIKVEEQDTDVTIYQITEDPLYKSSTYRETPFYSPDPGHFVVAQVNPKYEINPREYVIKSLLKLSERGTISIPREEANEN